jgi:uncharacterized sporulation protein YeaH/YhbH (DUF444 family)
MVSFVDRRLNPKNKSLGNRRRLIRRVAEEGHEARHAALLHKSCQGFIL